MTREKEIDIEPEDDGLEDEIEDSDDEDLGTNDNEDSNE